MPCYKEHKTIAGVVGGATAFVFAADQPPLQKLAEVAGGLFMGGHAGTWADCIEPGISSYHRQEAHAIVPSLVGANVVFQNLASFQGSLRQTAAQCFELAQATASPLQWELRLTSRPSQSGPEPSGGRLKGMLPSLT